MYVQDYNKVPQKNVRGKKGKSPGWEAGNHWVYCDICSSAIRAKDALKTWDNLIVCPDDFEPRHPQDFVRGRTDDTRAKEPVRSEPSDTFLVTSDGGFGPSSTTPPGTFNPGL